MSSPRMDRGWWKKEAVPLGHVGRNEKMMPETRRIRMEAFTMPSLGRREQVCREGLANILKTNSERVFPRTVVWVGSPCTIWWLRRLGM